MDLRPRETARGPRDCAGPERLRGARETLRRPDIDTPGPSVAASFRDSHNGGMPTADPPSAPATRRRLILINGEEGAGKTTIIRALLPHTPGSARIDAEDIGQTNPCPMDDDFFDLLRRNVAAVVQNFWNAGYVNVIAGSFLRNYGDYLAFRQLLPQADAVFMVELLVDKQERDQRRMTRAKQTTQEWRDTVDLIPEDRTIRQATDADYRYVGVDSTDVHVAATVREIKKAIPEIYSTAG
jgi:energy-coupling factor transporter ATP-binding protein EcfA2